MRSVISEVRCDQKMIERVRLKEKTRKVGWDIHDDQAPSKRGGQCSQREEGNFVPVDTVNKSSSTSNAPELDDGFTELEWPELREKGKVAAPSKLARIKTTPTRSFSIVSGT